MKHRFTLPVWVFASVLVAGTVGSVLKGNKPSMKKIAPGAAATAAGQFVGGSSIYRQFVQQFLAERGYQVIGWN